MKHLLRHWGGLREKLRDNYIFIFLDYDGTLAPIVKTPERARMPGRTRDALKALSRSPRCGVGVISGRSLEDIKSKIALESLIYSGNHGLEIEGPKIRHIVSVSDSYKKTLRRIKSELEKRVVPFRGAFIEDKGLSLTLHFRMCDPKQIPMVKTAFHEAVIMPLVSERVKVRAGKKVLEVRPPLEWDKGKVVLWLLARKKFSRPGEEVVPVYIGDDITDEDAFKALEHIGITVFVGRPKSSHARYYLRNPGEVREMLQLILKLRKDGGDV